MVATMLVRIAVWLAGSGALLFLFAGTIRWAGGWGYLVETAAGGVGIGLWLARHDPGLLAERLSPPFQPGQAFGDKVMVATLLTLVIAWFIVMALDAPRYHWSHVPAWLQVVGACVLALTFYIAFLAFRENTFAAPVVRIQFERAHHVIFTGPYSHVRHPLYAGAILYFIGVPLLLGSWYGLALAPLLTVLLAVRAVIEEEMLEAELDGYAEYAARVPYRLVPMVW